MILNTFRKKFKTPCFRNSKDHLAILRQKSINSNPLKWYWHDWSEPVELIAGLHFNIGEYLKQEGIEV